MLTSLPLTQEVLDIEQYAVELEADLSVRCLIGPLGAGGLGQVEFLRDIRSLSLWVGVMLVRGRKLTLTDGAVE